MYIFVLLIFIALNIFLIKKSILQYLQRSRNVYGGQTVYGRIHVISEG